MKRGEKGGDKKQYSAYSEIRDLFAIENIAPFTDEDLQGELKRDRLISQISQRPEVFKIERFRNHEGLGILIGLLDSYLSKFKFGGHSKESWDREYVFPRSNAVNRYRRRHRLGPIMENGPQSYIFPNASRAHVEKWIDEAVIKKLRSDQHLKKAVNILLGETGSGKSSFNKYVVSRHLGRFQENGIIASRIEYRKLSSFLHQSQVFKNTQQQVLEADIQKQSKEFILDCMVRDLFYHLYTDYKTIEPDILEEGTVPVACQMSLHPELDLSLQLQQESFKEFAKDIVPRITNEEINRVIEDINRTRASFLLPDMSKRRERLNRMLKDAETRRSLRLYVQYANDKGLRFFVILDGFDYIRASDFLEDSTHALVLQSLAEWLNTNGTTIESFDQLVSIQPLLQITMRLCTYGRLNRPGSQAFNLLDLETYHIVPPDFKHLFQVMVDNVEDQMQLGSEQQAANTITKNDILQMFTQAEKGLMKALNINRASINGLFQDNLRHRMNYMRDLFQEVARPIVLEDSDRQSLLPSAFAYQIKRQWSKFTTERNYRLVDILLCSKNDRFVNFVSVSDKITKWNAGNPHERYFIETALSDQNSKSGFVGNIFEYHIPYFSTDDFCFFLEKWRILKVLDKARNSHEFYMSADQIKDILEKSGVKVSEYFKISLAILLREAFINAIVDDNENGGYELSKLGQVAVDKLIYRISYLENVFFDCRLPAGIKRRTKDIFRNNVSTPEWVGRSIFHTYLLMRMIKSSHDKMGQSLGQEMSAKLLETFKDMRKGVPADKRDTPDDYFDIALSRISEFEERIQYEY